MSFISWIIILIGGTAAGVILNYLGDVLPFTRKLSPVKCLVCDHKIHVLDYLLLKKCVSCGQRRSTRAIIVMTISLVVTGLLWFFPPDVLGFWTAYGLFLYFGLVFLIDVEHRAILHPVSVVGVVIGIPLGIWLNGWLKTTIGGAAGFAIMFGLFYLGILFNRLVSKIRKQQVEEEALGFGDVNLTGVIGLMVGWPKIAINIVFAILLAGILSAIFILVTKLIKKYKPFTAIPYAPFLIISAWILFYLA